jgi:predicted ester cyclase
MAANENKDLVRRYLAELSGKDKPAEIVDKYVADEELKQHIAVFEAAFTRYELIADDLFAEGDRVAVRAIFKGHHNGELMGIPPTGKTVSLPVLLIYRVANGKIVDHWMSVDRLQLMEQLGVAPATGAGAR